MSKLRILREFWDFLKVKKRWWLAPIMVFLLLLGLLMLFTETSSVGVFIYTIF